MIHGCIFLWEKASDYGLRWKRSRVRWRIPFSYGRQPMVGTWKSMCLFMRDLLNGLGVSPPNGELLH